MSSSSKNNRKKNRNGRGHNQGSNGKIPAPPPAIGSGLGPTSPMPDTSVLTDSLQNIGGDIFLPPPTTVVDVIPEQETVQRLVSFLMTPSKSPGKPDEEVIPSTTYEEEIPRLDDYDVDDTPSIKTSHVPPADTEASQPVRSKAKPRARSTRVSEEQSQVDSAELLWYKSIHKSMFSTAPTGETFAIVPITLPSGLAIRTGDIIPSDAAELYVQHVQDTTQHTPNQSIWTSRQPQSQTPTNVHSRWFHNKSQ